MSSTDKRDPGSWRSIARIVHFARRHWLLIAAAIVATASYAGLEGYYVILLKPFIRAFMDLVRHREAGTPAFAKLDDIYAVAKIALALAPAVAVAAFLQHYLGDYLRFVLTVDLRNAVCRSILPQSLTFFEGRRSGDLMSRITNDVSRAQSSFNQLFSNLPEQLSKLVMGLALAAFFSWQLLLMGAVVGPLIVVPIGYLARRIRRYGRQGLEKLADITDLMAQMFTGIRIIKAFKMEDAEAQEFEHHNRQFMRKMMKMVTARAMSHGVIELVMRTFVGLGIFAGVWLVLNVGLRLEDMLLCLGGMYYAFDATRKLVKGYNELQESIPAADRMLEMLDHVPSLRDAPDATSLPAVRQGIVFQDVSFSYATEPVLCNVSVEVIRGETVAVVGRSGAGKSTLLALLPRFYDVTSGAVAIDGIDVRQVTRDSLLDRIAIVSQQTFLFNRTIADNIRYGRRDATLADVEQAARMANIHDFIVSQPGGYNALCGEFGGKLSGGQRQRIAIARALLKNADILILDEAMVGLDAESEALVQDALRNLMRGRTTFVITHDMATIQNADRILVLNAGRLVGQGRHVQLIETCPEYRGLCALQMGG